MAMALRSPAQVTQRGHSVLSHDVSVRTAATEARPLLKWDAEPVITTGAVTPLATSPGPSGTYDGYLYAMRRVVVDQPETLTVVLPGEKLPLTFYKNEIHTPEYLVQGSSGEAIKKEQLPGVHYALPKACGRYGAISFFPGRFFGVLGTDSGNVSIQEDLKDKGQYHVIKEWRHASPVRCKIEEVPGADHEHDSAPLPDQHDKAVMATSCKVVKVYWEADYKTYQDNGSNLVATNQYLTAMFNAVYTLYANDGLTIKLNQTFVWQTPDPYATQTSAFNVLYAFGTNRPLGTFAGNLAYLISTRRNNLGGIAYIEQLCAPAPWGFGNLYLSFEPLPTYSWSIYATAHEMGHIFGSRHTQWCGWVFPNGTTGRIDSCYSSEGTCPATTKPNYNGTIMSYCHIGGAINFNKGFGPLPKAKITASVQAASCLATASGADCAGGVLDPPTIVPLCLDRTFLPVVYKKSDGKWWGSFKITGNSTGKFWADLERQTGANAWTAGSRMSNYTPSSAQITGKLVDFTLNPQPWNVIPGTNLYPGTYTYRLTVWGDGTGCNNAKLPGLGVLVAP